MLRARCVTVCFFVLKCVSLCCSVFLCVAVCFFVLQRDSVRCSALQFVISIHRRNNVVDVKGTVCCSLLQCVAVCFFVLQCVAVCDFDPQTNRCGRCLGQSVK